MSVESTTLASMPILGVGLAVASAAAMSVGNIWQSKGVDLATKNKGDKPLFVSMLKTGIWLAGTGMFALAVLLQMGSLAFAPLMVVQPIGVLALVFAVFLTARATGKKPNPGVLKAVAICLSGVFVYVIIAAMVSKQKAISDGQLVAVLVALLIALIAAGIVRLVNHGSSRKAPILYVLLGAVFSSFVATLGKTVILRIQSLFAGHHFSLDHGGLLTIFCVIGIGIASALSIYCVQTAYTCNPSDVVVAGLTVVDPAVAVILGITILNEAAGAPVWSLFAIAVAGAVAIYGVLKLSKAENPPRKGTVEEDAAVGKSPL
ncbi:MAG: multidrug DMT transporter permease [Leucobacter sp.]